MSRKKLIIIITAFLSLIIATSAVFILQPNDTTTEKTVEEEKTITFAIFSDFHYKKLMYSTTVDDMDAILDRANAANADFVLSAGDFSNDYAGSPEITNAFLNNKYNLPVYNVYGNHELESGNTMQYVTPMLTNDKNAVWGTADGKIGDGSIAYYYFDYNGFRVICTDTNYSFNPTINTWEHNADGSYTYPTGNTLGYSLGPEQLAWLEKTLLDAADKELSCIILAHDSFSGEFRSISPDAEAVRALYNKANKKRAGTVLISINGHIHSNNTAVIDDVLYIDVNSTRNTVWKADAEPHYTAEHTFDMVEYNLFGEAYFTYPMPLDELTMGKKTWFSADPLSAIVTVSKSGDVTIDGTESEWLYGIAPTDKYPDEEPRISSGKWELLNK